jgi:hypothetical protein
MAVLTVQNAIRATNGINLAGVAAGAGGDSFPNDGKTVFVIRNGSGASITLTVVTPVTVDGLAVADLTATIGAGETRSVGPFPPAWYNDAGGSVNVTYSAVTTVTVVPLSVNPTA